MNASKLTLPTVLKSSAMDPVAASVRIVVEVVLLGTCLLTVSLVALVFDFGSVFVLLSLPSGLTSV
ncbi:hypothetical protein PsorP6_011973 [Peronosclerospora sorghi]|uniref:Uncharacterized protein n=1 Tax=Peronosclerospora sorghi TaxID=230839 RepID=A0ACC0WLS0_9STRA|nr:hypothetical protein PsorP6_011973 [Peronosclerospora sorghi]